MSVGVGAGIDVVVGAGFFDVADGAGGFEAVHDWHADVWRWVR